jgi:DNA modification methylase
MEIRTMPIADLHPADYNPRKNLKPGDAEYEKLKRSIQTFGNVEPIVWNQRTATVVGGHQRLKVLAELGETVVECVVVDLDAADEKALNVALNKISGDWDLPLLKDLIDDLKQDGAFDVTLTGFDKYELYQLFPEAIDGVRDDGFDPDKETDFTVPPFTERGDVWTLGPHRLVCGDSLKADEVAVLMNGVKANMVFTDPPYNVDYGANKMNVRWKIRKIEGDHQTKDEWDVFCREMTQRLLENCEGDLYVWGASGPDGMRQRLTLIELGAHWSATIIWKKQQLVLSPAKYQRIYEPCFYGWPDGVRSSYVGDRKQVELWEFERPRDSKLHPTMKPIPLCANAIANSSSKGDIVLDLFGGSGSTLIAADQTGRVCYMMELLPKYCDVIVKRYRIHAGADAEIACHRNGEKVRPPDEWFAERPD